MATQNEPSRLIVTIPFEEVPEESTTVGTPTLATVREVDFATDSAGNLNFFYSRGSNDVDLARYNGIGGLADALIGENFDYDIDREPPLQDPPTSDRYFSRLSLRNGELRYVVYALSDRNWQFARLGRPITIGTTAVESAVYLRARRVWATGADGYDEGTEFDADESLARNGSRVAYMIADGAAARQKQEPYSHRINLHVDLKFSGPRFIPLMVDPDIRFPGGSLD